MWEVFKSGIVLLGLLLYFVPLLFAIRYQKTKSECSPALVSESEVRFTMLDDCWFFHLKGIVISIVLALIIGILVIVIRKIDATMSGSKVYSISNLLVFAYSLFMMSLVCFAYILFFFRCRRNYLSIKSGLLEFKKDNKVVSIAIDRVEKIKFSKTMFIVCCQNQKALKLKKDDLRLFVDSEKLISKLEKFSIEFQQTRDILSTFQG